MNKCSSSSSCFSSVDVVSHCDDLITEILLRLPPNSVFKFKCVSKTWNRLISDPIFCSNYKSRRQKSLLPLMGFFRSTLAADRSTLENSFLPNCKERKFTKLDFIENYSLDHVSPEGLMLCSFEVFRVCNYCVFNPVRNQCFALPKTNMGHVPASSGFSCEEYCIKDGVVHFKVIRAIREQGATYDRFPIEIFSSRTGKWSVSFLTPPSQFSDGCTFEFDSVGGIFYWKVSGHFAAYDPNRGENRLWLIKLPPPCCKREGYMNYILGQSPDGNGCLRFALNEKQRFRVWDLKKKLSSYSLFHIIPSSEWMFKEVVSYKKLDIINYFPTGHAPQIRSLDKFPSLMAFHPRNSKLVYLRRGSNMFCYDFETRKVEPIQYYYNHGTVLPNDNLIPYFQPPWPPSLPSVKPCLNSKAYRNNILHSV